MSSFLLNTTGNENVLRAGSWKWIRWSKGGHEQEMQNPNPAKLFIFYAERSVSFVLIETARKQACAKSCTHSTSAKTSLIVIFFYFQFLIFHCYENAICSVWWDTQRRSEMQMHEDSALIKVNNYSGPVKIHWSDFSVDVPTFFSWEVMYIGHTGFFPLFFFHYRNSLHMDCTMWTSGI